MLQYSIFYHNFLSFTSVFKTTTKLQVSLFLIEKILKYFLYLNVSVNQSNEPTPRHPTIQDILMKIRFLTLSPQQFAEGPATSNLLTQAEKFAILMNISSSSTDVQMPSGFSTSTVPRQSKNVGDSLYHVSTI